MERDEPFMDWFVLGVKFRIILLILPSMNSIHFGCIFDRS